MILGRHRELGVVLDVLAGGALVVSGEAGVGKSTLLDRARAAHRGLVVHATGVEAEEHLAFAALADLTRPLRHRFGELANPRRTALEVALGLREGAAPDRAGVSMAALELMELAARTQPLLVLVDDLHWLDASSAEVLAFVARRLQPGSGPALLAATRPGPSRLPGAPELAVAGLGTADALALLRRGGVADAPAQQIAEQARGNPLALREIPAELSDDERAGRAPLPDPLPAGPGLASVYARRIARLPPGTPEALALLAWHGPRDPEILLRAMRDAAIDPRVLVDAEAAGLVRREEAAWDFAHPLVRAAAADAVAPGRARALRGVLADHSTGAARAWLRAAGADEPDEAAAAELEACGVEAEARAALAAAAEAYAGAARLSGDPVASSRRNLATARVALLLGRLELARAAIERLARASLEPADRADTDALLGVLVLLEGQPTHARELLERGAARVRDLDPGRAAGLLVTAGTCLMAAGDMVALEDTARRALALAQAAGPGAELVPSVLLADACAARGDVLTARRLLDAHASELGTLGGAVALHEVVVVAALCWVILDEWDRAEDLLGPMVASARERGAVRALPLPLVVQGSVALFRGNWPRARALLEEAVRLADELAPPFVQSHAHAQLAYLDALQGREEACREQVARGVALDEEFGLSGSRAMHRMALGELELGLGRPARAVEHLAAAAAHLSAYGVEHPGFMPAEPDLVEALVLAGRADEAARRLTRYAPRAQQVGGQWASSALHRCRGLLSPDEELDEHFTRALEALVLPGGFYRARVLLCWGERLRRARRGLDARERLAEALALFDGCGAAPWAARARRELAAAQGRRTADAAAPADGAPSARQRMVLRLAAEGQTNREIAETLYVSPKTVEHHLRQGFRVLGVRSRVELVRLAAGRPELLGD